MKNWSRSMLIVTAGLTVLSILLRHPIASAVGVDHVVTGPTGHHVVHSYAWAAAIGIPAGCLYLEVSLLRGALQGAGDYKGVGLSLIGEQGVRLVTGVILAIPFGVTGAFFGSLLSYVGMSLYCGVRLRQYAESYAARAPGTIAQPTTTLWRHVRGALVPIAGLAVIAVLQNIDLIAAKHRFTTDTATSYAAVAVAAKVVVWVAIGAGFYLVPEVARRRAAGEDTRTVLLKTLAIIAVVSIPCLLIFAFASKLLITTVFGAKKAHASDSLLPLGAAFTVLACTYLAIQYMLALKRRWFLLAIGVIAIAEPVLLLQAPKNAAGFAVVVLAIQSAAALLAFAMALRRREARRTAAVRVEPV
jgi:O-antigen/teichoic acid export membrane protein